MWVLGAGGSTAPLAGELGAGYAHEHFFRTPAAARKPPTPIGEAADEAGHAAHTMLAVRVITAETEQRAQAQGDAMLLWRACKDLGQDGPIPSAETTARHGWSDQERIRAKARGKAIIAAPPTRCMPS